MSDSENDEEEKKKKVTQPRFKRVARRRGLNITVNTPPAQEQKGYSPPPSPHAYEDDPDDGYQYPPVRAEVFGPMQRRVMRRERVENEAIHRDAHFNAMQGGPVKNALTVMNVHLPTVVMDSIAAYKSDMTKALNVPFTTRTRATVMMDEHTHSFVTVRLPLNRENTLVYSTKHDVILCTTRGSHDIYLFSMETCQPCTPNHLSLGDPDVVMNRLILGDIVLSLDESVVAIMYGDGDRSFVDVFETGGTWNKIASTVVTAYGELVFIPNTSVLVVVSQDYYTSNVRPHVFVDYRAHPVALSAGTTGRFDFMGYSAGVLSFNTRQCMFNTSTPAGRTVIQFDTTRASPDEAEIEDQFDRFPLIHGALPAGVLKPVAVAPDDSFVITMSVVLTDNNLDYVMHVTRVNMATGETEATRTFDDTPPTSASYIALLSPNGFYVAIHNKYNGNVYVLLSETLEVVATYSIDRFGRTGSRVWFTRNSRALMIYTNRESLTRHEI